ncbi:siderophore-interacting protein [Actinopolymorpha singaporensis]|uniref:NADPH-dependent ferric siderophore reductase, contains FAD-binding and SIP domains n=1 Tax=Actinopolymorpha singaporensis TaxID=117157 RepID=A0A1H1P6E9_9ACTN|nr:siderophore-interacting protein [Actinopolymorpha singaporensis]SDS06219.1 NADPH-dependent ferric siderophore reductase, contains FAD-binding and SIP domains [Actinopolymorpha singaporensis]
MTTTTGRTLPVILSEVEAVGVERLSPSFVRVELAGPELADFGVQGELYDQRIKLIFPGPSGVLPSLAGEESWYSAWLSLPDAERGHMRTYTVRDVRGAGRDARVVVDFVLHGESGPGSCWAAKARVHDRLLLVGPRRGVHFGGIEFDPCGLREVLLVADETAVPAACSILSALDALHADVCGAAFLEVPESGDVLDIPAPAGIDVVWLPRDGAAHGRRQVAAVRRHLGLAPTRELVDDRQVLPDLWETPTYSSSGEPIDAPTADRTADPTTGAGKWGGLYAWIAGESKVVTTLRRCLVKEAGLDRRQVAFMGYWRHGVAMRG